MRHLDGAPIATDITSFVVKHPHSQEPMCIAMVTRDIRERKRAEAEITALNSSLRQHAADLEVALAESEEFAYAAAHNLRSPLRGIDGFAQAVLEDCGEDLRELGRNYLSRVRRSARQMADLIDDLLGLSRISRTTMQRQTLDLSAMARAVFADLQKGEPARGVEMTVQDHLTACGDEELLRLVLQNLLANAWKFSATRTPARIEFGCKPSVDAKTCFYIKDNGVGFDMAYANKLFVPFERLHSETEFPGNGIGLATVKRIIQRHGGRVWADAAVDVGATIYFTLG